MDNNNSKAGSAGVLTRRSMLQSTVASGTAAMVPLIATSSCSTPVTTPAVFTTQEQLVLAAFTDRILPADELGPGATASGVPDYINRSLSDWNSAELPFLQNGLQNLDATAHARHGSGFAELDSGQQDSLMEAMEAGALEGFDDAQQVFNRLYRLTLEGMFSDPWYGGNRNFAGWDLIGYPGAVLGSTADMQRMGERLPPLHTSAYGAEHDGDLTP